MIKWSSYVKPCVFFTQECFVPSLLEIGKWFWRRRFLNLGNVFLLFFNYLPLEKGVVLHLYKLEPPSPKDALSQVRLKLAQRSCRKRWKCEKFTDGWTGGRWTTGDQKSLLRLRWVKKNLLKNLLMFNIHYIEALNVCTIYESIISNKNILSSQVWNKQSPK